MIEDPASDAGRRTRLWPHPTLASLLAVALLLLFCWPFVEVPRPSLPAAFLHVFVCWTAAIGLLWWISRGYGRGPGADRGDDDG